MASVERYIEAVTELLEADPEVGPEALEAMARELGLDDSALEAVAAEAQACQTRARNYLEHGQVARAAKEAARAVALKPHDVAAKLLLAEALAGDPRSQTLLDEVVKAEPDNQAAYALMAVSSQPTLQRRDSTLWFWAPVAAGGLLAVAIYGFAFDSLSERSLVRATALWLYPMLFGLHAVLAERVGPEPTLKRVWEEALGSFALLGPVLTLPYALLPFVFLKARTPVAAAIGTTLFWAFMVSVVFFEGIWPSL